MKPYLLVLVAAATLPLLGCSENTGVQHGNTENTDASNLSNATDDLPGNAPFDSATTGAPSSKYGADSVSQTDSNLSTGSQPSDLIRLEPNVIMDTAGFGQPMVAATIFVPYGWQSEGGIVWGSQFACTNGYALRWMAQSPDQQHAVAYLPQQRWEWNSMGQPSQPGCQMAQVDSVQGYVNAILPELVPNARIVEFRHRPDLEGELDSLNSFSNDGFQQIQSQVQAAEAIVEFDLEGVAMRGMLITAAQFTHIRTGGGQFGVVTENLTGFALPAFGAYAPVAEFNPAIFEAIRKSLISNPAWDAQIAQHNSTMGRINSQGAINRANIHNQAMQDIAEIRNDAWAAQQKSADVRAREFVEYIRDVETYSDADAPAGQVELNSFYQHAWRLDDGSYVMTNDTSFQPQRDLGINGRQLSVLR